MAQILVRDVDERCLQALKTIAKRHRRSLQAEVKEILELTAATMKQNHLKASKKIKDQLRDRAHTDSVKLLSEDRKR